MKIHSITLNQFVQTNRKKTEKPNFGQIPVAQAAKSFPIEAFIIIASQRKFPKSKENVQLTSDLMSFMMGDQFWSDIQRLCPKPLDDVMRPVVLPECLNACRMKIFDVYPDILKAEIDANPETLHMQAAQVFSSLDIRQIKEHLMSKGLAESLEITPFSVDELKTLLGSVIKAVRNSN